MQNSLVSNSREQTVKMAYDLGFKYLEAAICPQASFAALQGVFQFRDDTVFKSLTGFLGGGGDTCLGACGGLVGGVAAISYLFGRSRTEFDYKIWDLSLRVLVKKLFDGFTKEFDGICCQDVHKKMFGCTFDLFDKKEEELFLDTIEKDERGGCSYPVAVASSLAAGIIWDELHNPNRVREDLYSY